jgi:thiamine pyrophosphate-dependent acetolactate synthase large subunit-like protein
MPEDGLLWADMTGPAYVGISEYPVFHPRSFLHPVGFGTLGVALPAAIGSKIGSPEKAVCALAGDGGFQFTLPEIAVAADLGLTIPIVLWNDCGYGEIRRNQNIRHPGQTIAVDHKCTDYAALSEVYGIKGEKITSMEGLSKALKLALHRSGPTILDVRVKECF